ncbi:DUF47 family protein [Ensifer canadensis]
MKTRQTASPAKCFWPFVASFITPFDRGDIKDLIQSMDDAIDMMHKTVKTIRLLRAEDLRSGHEGNGRHRRPGRAPDRRGHSAARSHRRQPRPRLIAIAEEVTRIEGRSDELHDQGLKDLFRRYGANNAMAYIIGSEIYGELEKVVDRFEDVANEISGIVIENV